MVGSKGRVRSVWALIVVGVAALLAGAPVAAQRAPGAFAFDIGGHTGPVRRLAADAAGRWVVTAGDDQTAIVWRSADARPLHTLRVPVDEDAGGRLYGAALSPDGATVAVGGSTGGTSRIHLFDRATGAFRAAFEPQPGGLRNLQWSADGGWLAAVYVGRAALRVFGAEGALRAETALPADAYGLSLSAAGQLAVTSFDGRLRLFRFEGGALRAEGEIATPVADPVSVRHSPDGRLLAVGYFSRDLAPEAAGAVVVDVFDAATRERVRRFAFGDVDSGNLMSVAWQADGRALYAAGTGAAGRGRALLRRIAWPAGDVAAALVDADTVSDFAALPGGAMAFASLDGRWGRLEGLQTTARGEAPWLRVADAGALRLSEDGQRADWRSSEGRRASFSLTRREAGSGDDDTRAPATASALPAPGWRVEGWAHTRAPRVAGQVVELPAGEISRAAAVWPDGESALLGTSRALRRVGRDGRTWWTVPLPAEARAVAVSGDGRTLVAALADGTLRWRRAEDGAALAGLLLLQDGRWALWNAQGEVDTAPGAQDLVGWCVTRPGGARADYHGAARVRRAAGETVAWPPVVTLAAPAVAAGDELAVDVELYTPPGGTLERLSVEVDGQAVDARFMPGAEGAARGRITLAAPAPGARVALQAEGAGGRSVPLVFTAGGETVAAFSAPGAGPAAAARAMPTPPAPASAAAATAAPH